MEQWADQMFCSPNQSQHLNGVAIGNAQAYDHIVNHLNFEAIKEFYSQTMESSDD